MNEYTLIGFVLGMILYTTVAFVLNKYETYKDTKQYEKDQIYAAIDRLDQRISKLEKK